MSVHREGQVLPKAGAAMSLLSCSTDLGARCQVHRGPPHPGSDLGPGTPCSFAPGRTEYWKPGPAAGPGQGNVDGPPAPLPAAEHLTCEGLPGPAGGRGWGGG